MPIEIRSLPYEMLIRFSEGAPHQIAKIGEFEGAHYIERKRLVDTATGEIVGTPKGEEQDRAVALPQDKVADYLGERFAAIEAGHRAAVSAHKSAVAEQQRLARELEAAQDQLAELTRINQELTSERDALRQRLNAIAQHAAG